MIAKNATRLSRLGLSVAISLLTWSIGVAAPAAVLHESATLGPTNKVVGVSLGSGQFAGSRFHVEQPVQVNAIGGHLLSSGTLFGALVSLSEPAGFPLGAPQNGPVIASTVFTATLQSSDFRTPLSASLSPGDYALVFGAGRFGATGFGFMLNNNVDLPGGDSYFLATGGVAWGNVPATNPAFHNLRFVVEGTVVPEAGANLLTALAGLSVCGRVARRGRCALVLKAPAS